MEHLTPTTAGLEVSEAKFTPGPWDAWIECSAYCMTGPAAAASMTAVNALRESGDEALFVELSSKSSACPALALGNTPEQAKANARLIAAAPDLLAACQALIAYDESDSDGLGFMALYSTAIEKARDAIANATGSEA